MLFFDYIIWNIDLKLLPTQSWIKYCVFTCCSWRHWSNRIVIWNSKYCNFLKKFAETGWTYLGLFVWLIINGSKVGHCKSFLSKLLSKPQALCRHYASFTLYTRFSLFIALCVTCILALCTNGLYAALAPLSGCPDNLNSLPVLSGGVWIWT